MSDLIERLRQRGQQPTANIDSGMPAPVAAAQDQAQAPPALTPTRQRFEAFAGQQAQRFYPGDPDGRKKLTADQFNDVAGRYRKEVLPMLPFEKGQDKRLSMEARHAAFDQFVLDSVGAITPAAAKAPADAQGGTASDTAKMALGSLSQAGGALGTLAALTNPAAGGLRGVQAIASRFGADRLAQESGAFARQLTAPALAIESAGQAGRAAMNETLTDEQKQFQDGLRQSMDEGAFETGAYLLGNKADAFQMAMAELPSSIIPGGIAAKLAGKGSVALAGMKPISAAAGAALGTEVAIGAGQAAGASAQEVEERLLADPPADFTLEARRLSQGPDGLVPDTPTEQGIRLALDARQATARGIAAGVSAPLNAATLGLTRRFGGTVVEEALAGVGGAGRGLGSGRGALKAIKGEGPSEFAQGAADQLAQNAGTIAAGARPMGDLGQGVGANAVLEGTLGVTMAAPIGAIQGARTGPVDEDTPPALDGGRIPANPPADGRPSREDVEKAYSDLKTAKYFTKFATINDENRGLATDELVDILMKQRSDGSSQLGNYASKLMKAQAANGAVPLSDDQARAAIVDGFAQQAGIPAADILSRLNPPAPNPLRTVVDDYVTKQVKQFAGPEANITNENRDFATKSVGESLLSKLPNGNSRITELAALVNKGLKSASLDQLTDSDMRDQIVADIATRMGIAPEALANQVVPPVSENDGSEELRNAINGLLVGPALGPNAVISNQNRGEAVNTVAATLLKRRPNGLSELDQRVAMVNFERSANGLPNLSAADARTTIIGDLANRLGVPSDVLNQAVDPKSGDGIVEIDNVVNKLAEKELKLFIGTGSLITPENVVFALDSVARTLTNRLRSGNTLLTELSGNIAKDRKANSTVAMQDADIKTSIVNTIADRLGVPPEVLAESIAKYSKPKQPNQQPASAGQQQSDGLSSPQIGSENTKALPPGDLGQPKKKVGKGPQFSLRDPGFERGPLPRRIDPGGIQRLSSAIASQFGDAEGRNFVAAEPTWPAEIDTAVARLSEFFKKKVVVFSYLGTNQQINANGVVIQNDDAIFINAATDRPATVIFGHELSHDMEKSDPALFAELVDKLRPYYNEQNAAKYFLVAGQDRAGQEAELVADIFGDVIGGENFLATLSATDKPLMQKVLDFVDTWVNKLIKLTKSRLGLRSSDAGLVTDLEAVKRIVEDIANKFARAGSKQSPELMATAIKFALKNGDMDTHAAEAASEQIKHTSLLSNVPKKNQAEIRSKWDSLKDKLFDNTRYMRKAEEKVTAETGKMIPFEERPHAAFTSISGLLSETNRQDDLNAINPMIDYIGDFWNQNKDSKQLLAQNIKSVNDLIEATGRYMYAANHARERNSVGTWLHSTLTETGNAKRNKIYEDYYSDEISVEDARTALEELIDDPQYVTKLETASSGMTNSMVNQVRAAGKASGLDKLSEQIRPFVREAGRRQLDHRDKAGMSTSGSKRKIALYGWTDYMPAKGFTPEKMADEGASSFSVTANGYGGLQPRMEGRKSEAFDYLPTLINDLRVSASVMENQKALRVLSNFARKYPDAIPGVSIRQIRMAAPNGSVRTSLGKTANEFAAFRGETIDILKVPNDIAANMKSGFTSIGTFFQVVGIYNSIKGRMLTTLSPSFWPIAYGMDFLNTASHVLGRHPKALAGYFANQLEQGFVGASVVYAFTDVGKRDIEAAKSPKGFTAWARRYEKSGGETYIADALGGFGVKNAMSELGARTKRDAFGKAISNTIGAGGKQIVDLATLETFYTISNGMEMASRVAAFKALVEKSGLSDREAAITTKEFMNFNRSGTWGKQLNSMFLFSRVTLTALDATKQLVTSNNGKNAVIAAAVALALVSYVGLTAGMPEEERKKLNNVGLAKNYAFSFFGEIYQFPIAYGPNRLFGQVAISLAMLQDGSMSTGEAMGSVLNAIRENASGLPQTGVNPAEDTKLYAFRSVMPTLVADLEPFLSNLDFWGRPLHVPKEYTSGYAFENGRANTPKLYTDIAKTMYTTIRDIAGPDVAKNFDVYPEQIQYTTTLAFGGIGNMINNTLKGNQNRELGISDRSPLGQALFGRMVNKDADWAELRRFKKLEVKLDDATKDLKSDTYKEGVSQKTRENARILSEIRKTSKRYSEMRNNAKTPDQQKAAIAEQKAAYIRLIDTWNEANPDDEV